MLLCGLQKTTLLDYPGHVAATVFTGGCNFRCPFCHNGELVLKPQDFPSLPKDEILHFLQKRKGVLEGVCVTGGEPTLQEGLEDFLREIKEMGYLLKLDTNGYRPDVLRKLMKEKLLDYVAMDVKACRDNYARATGLPLMDTRRIEESVELLKKQGEIPYEFRTTVVRGIHTPEEFEEIGAWLRGAATYFLQGYRESKTLLRNLSQKSLGTDEETAFSAFSLEEMEKMAEKARKYIARVEVRGVE